MFDAERKENGQFTSRPAAIEQYSFTKDNASAMAKRRWDKYREAAADAITEEMGTIQPGVTTPEKAWGVLNARLAVQIIDSDKPRGDDLRLLGQNMGAIASASERTEVENSATPTQALEAGLALVRLMADVMQGQRREIVDAEAVDATDTRSNEAIGGGNGA